MTTDSSTTPSTAGAPHAPPRGWVPDGVGDRSVAELEGLEVPPGAYGMGSVAWLSRALVSPLRDLGPAELRLLVSHGRGLRWVVPAALRRLEAAPFVAGDHHPGDLLTAVLSTDPAHWDAHLEQRDALGRVTAVARERLHELPEPLRARLSDDLDAAREHLGL